jgi:adenylosuccinate lyase
MENVALWHERDISHSSAERIIGPDSTTALDFMLARFSGVVKNLLVYPENMQANMAKTRGLFYSQKILLELTKKGVSREDSYRLVQKNALEAWEQNRDFKDMLMQDKAITDIIPRNEIEQLCSLDIFTKHVDDIFGRVFAE